PPQPQAVEDCSQQQRVQAGDDAGRQRSGDGAAERVRAQPQAGALRRVGEAGSGPQRVQAQAPGGAAGGQFVEREQSEEQLRLEPDLDLDLDPEPELDLEPDLETVVRLAMARLYSEDDSRMRSPTCSASIAAAPSRSSANSV